MSKKLSIKANFKKATKKDEVKSDAWSLLAAPLWILPSSLLKLSGWSGLGVSFLSTWLTGAIFDIQGLRRGAFALAATHVVYAKGTTFMANTLKIPMWDMYGTKAVTTTTVKGLRDYLQPGTQVINPAGNKQIVARTMDGYIQPHTMMGLNDSPFAMEAKSAIGI